VIWLGDRGRNSRLPGHSPSEPYVRGSPAYGSPVGGSPPSGLTGQSLGCGKEEQPLLGKEAVGPAHALFKVVSQKVETTGKPWIDDAGLEGVQGYLRAGPRTSRWFGDQLREPLGWL
jgi:hypothetical protein